MARTFNQDVINLKKKLSSQEVLLRLLDEKLNKLIKQSPKQVPIKQPQKSEKKKDEEYSLMFNKIEKVLSNFSSVTKRINILESSEGTRMSDVKQIKNKTKAFSKEIKEQFTTLVQTCDGISKRMFHNEQSTFNLEHQVNLIK